ncbi:MAG: tripartite tricarboxylate transporter substrate binding protein [Alcaligenaceae bacterium]|jgi:tripartite-type tricarboxylate transporter receptor subunit TctC|nr:tripartite tricarboxylate transporter substrate binding protein [Alcaligenaceae bacterium]
MQRSARWLGFLISVTVTSVLSASAQAQVVGAKPITVIVPYATGGATDIVARMVAQQLGTRLGTPVIVENRQGGGGVVGWNAAARAAPDGNTLLAMEMSYSISAGLTPNLPYNPKTAFIPINTAVSVGHVLVINPAVPAKNIKELIALAKAEPGKLNFGSGGTGTNTHLGGELLKAKLGISMTHVPYRGAGAVLADLMAGQVQVLVSAVSTTLPLVQAGKLRALMMLSDKRSDVLPDVPTAAEEGFPGLEMNYWVGFAAPQGTPQAVVDKLNQEINAGLLTPESQKRLKEMAFVPVANTPAQAAQLLESEINRWSTLIKQQGIQAE